MERERRFCRGQWKGMGVILGILVNTDGHLAHVLGLTTAAVNKGHEVTIFVMDSGTRLLRDDSFVALAGADGVSMSFCDHSAREHEIDTDTLPPEVEGGSQLNNAVMNHQAARMIVL
ncbi:MAG: DsrE family protein [Alphaproteobacteria bacterium]|jgi:hypothetical protein|nr:DsrE family protein [Alphaproteobacteria bacterium]|tara:strand:- start:561 stop:911 length:351 start_codon:yes stop_codon:yes gene_type:complete